MSKDGAETRWRWSALRYWGEYGALRLLRLFLHLLPIDVGSAMMGWFWGVIAPFLHRHERVLDHLAKAYPLETREFHQKIAAGMWRNLGRVFAESLMVDRLVQAGRFKVTTPQIIAETQESGRGIVFISLHSGNWEMAIVGAVQSGIKAAGVYQRLKNPHVDAWLQRLRRKYYPRGLFPKGGDIARRLFRIVREGGAVALLADLRDRRGVSVPFFGRPAPTNSFPALLARNGNAALIAARVIRTGGTHLILEAVPVPVPQTADRDADVLAATIAVHALFETWIREYPEQWMWGHRRWG